MTVLLLQIATSHTLDRQTGSPFLLFRFLSIRIPPNNSVRLIDAVADTLDEGIIADIGWFLLIKSLFLGYILSSNPKNTPSALAGNTGRRRGVGQPAGGCTSYRKMSSVRLNMHRIEEKQDRCN